jgi:hypothetical protein
LGRGYAGASLRQRHALRRALTSIICGRRYTDSPDSAWHIGVHPADPGLLFATGGSGHAFKVRLLCLSVLTLYDTEPARMRSSSR